MNPLVIQSPVGLSYLTLLHSERPKLYTILTFLSAIGLKMKPFTECQFNNSDSCSFGPPYLKMKLVTALGREKVQVTKYEVSRTDTYLFFRFQVGLHWT